MGSQHASSQARQMKRSKDDSDVDGENNNGTDQPNMDGLHNEQVT